ncbi:hypothetical protein [Pseudomonas cavernae]|uniref:hypothetical protein n=1 Tax=Pseudomonas cavernae TaxID=2320867 RepID=UPI0013C51570|nr:hypothetical protein [Pseudomonas cavernae]
MDKRKVSFGRIIKTPKKRIIRRLLNTLCSALSLILVLSATAAAADVFRFKGENVVARFLDVPSDPCVSTAVVIQVVNGVARNHPGETELSTLLFLVFTQFDTCSSVVLKNINAVQPIPARDLSVGPKSALLNTNAFFHDFTTNADYNFQINLAWSCVSPHQRTHGTNHSISGGGSGGAPVIINSNFTDVSCAAQASGSISDGVTSLALPISTDGFVGKSSVGQISKLP